jgi:XTP/dITP diphosphohydrolase
VASSNPGKLREFRVLAESAGVSIELSLLPNFGALPEFEESAPTFAENAVGKALHYSRFTGELLLADDSGLVVPALGGAPGVYSARYAGAGASDSDRVQKVLREMRGKTGNDRRARFVSVIAVVQRGECRGIFSGFVEGVLLDAPRGEGGFGYDPIFLIPSLGRTFSEISPEEKNRYSHRGMAFGKAISYLESFGNIDARKNETSGK